MYEESELSYFKGGLAVGIGLGLLSGVASTIWYHRKKVLSADQVLENIKTSFLKEGAIEGSWISFEKEPISSQTYIDLRIKYDFFCRPIVFIIAYFFW